MITEPDVVPALVVKVCAVVKNAKTEFVFVSEKVVDAPVMAAVTLKGP